MKFLVCFLLFLIGNIGIAGAVEESIFTKYENSLIDYTGNGGDDYHSDIKMKTIGDTTAGIDIVGFRHMYEQNGNFYISSIDDIILDYEAKNSDGDAGIMKTDYWDNGDGTVTAELTCREPDQMAKFYDTETLPTVVEGLTEVSMNVSVFNNTFKPKTVFYVHSSVETTKVSYEYENVTWHIIRMGEVRETPKEVEYLHLEPINDWTNTGGIGTLGGYYTIPKALTPAQIQHVYVVAYDVHGDKQILFPQNIDIYNEDLTSGINPYAVLYVACTSTLLIGTAVVVRSMKWHR